MELTLFKLELINYTKTTGNRTLEVNDLVNLIKNVEIKIKREQHKQHQIEENIVNRCLNPNQ